MTEISDRNGAHDRDSDKGFLCRVAHIFSLGWDWIDKRQIDCWAVTIFTGAVSYRLTEWAVHFANNNPRSGSDIALIIGSIMAPWSLLQAACIKFVFDARRTSFITSDKP